MGPGSGVRSHELEGGSKSRTGRRMASGGCIQLVRGARQDWWGNSAQRGCTPKEYLSSWKGAAVRGEPPQTRARGMHLSAALNTSAGEPPGWRGGGPRLAGAAAEGQLGAAARDPAAMRTVWLPPAFRVAPAPACISGAGPLITHTGRCRRGACHAWQRTPCSHLGGAGQGRDSSGGAGIASVARARQRQLATAVASGSAWLVAWASRLTLQGPCCSQCWRWWKQEELAQSDVWREGQRQAGGGGGWGSPAGQSERARRHQHRNS